MSVALISLGYEGRTVDEVVELCRRHEVTVLVDVRLTPMSRKPGLSKTRLSEHLQAAGIRYLHLPTLGNPKDNRAAFATVDSAPEGRARFRTLLQAPAAVGALQHVGRLLASERVALLCFERDPAQCHRSVVIDELCERFPTNTALAHI